MDCRILRMLTLKSNGQLVCDDSSGYGIVLGEVSLGIGWNILNVINGPIYAHVRRSFAEGRPPWPNVCERCHTFSDGGRPIDTLGSRIRLMVEPTLSCNLGCPSCMRKREGKRRTGSWDLDPDILEALVRSCAKNDIEIEEVHYLGWGEPLLYEDLGRLTKLVRKWHPHCVQELTTSGSVDDPSVLTDVDLDKLTISCDGVRQESYVQYRRGGEIGKVFRLMEFSRTLKNKPYVEWKYILFDHNDSDEDVFDAQKMAEAYELDSLLFIITHSKKSSQRFHKDNIKEFPITFANAWISPAAGMMTVKLAGRILSEASELGDLEDVSLYVDQALITHSNIMELRGWALRADGKYVDKIEVFHGPRLLGSAKMNERRRDVQKARAYATGPDCGFTFKIPIINEQPYRTLHFLVWSGNQQHELSAALSFEAIT